MEAEPGDLAVPVEADPDHRLASLEVQQDIDHDGPSVGPDRGYVTHGLVGPEHADQLRPPAAEAATVMALAHDAVEVREHLIPAARGEVGEERVRPLGRAGRDGAGHRLTGARVDRVPEPLERGLPAGAEYITDLLPTLPGAPGTVDGFLQGRLRGG